MLTVSRYTQYSLFKWLRSYSQVMCTFQTVIQSFCWILYMKLKKWHGAVAPLFNNGQKSNMFSISAQLWFLRKSPSTATIRKQKSAFCRRLMTFTSPHCSWPRRPSASSMSRQPNTMATLDDYTSPWGNLRCVCLCLSVSVALSVWFAFVCVYVRTHTSWATLWLK